MPKLSTIACSRSSCALADADSPYLPLPNGAGMRVAVRRTLRVGKRAGTPVEDLGIIPDACHFLEDYAA
jgi:hypothetical protein